MLNIDIAPPIAFAAANCQFLAQVPNGIEGYWSADIKAVRRGVLHEIFTGVLFVEKPGELVFLAGIESPDGIDRHIRSDAAAKQAEFIRFLRDENDRDNAALGILAGVFQGREYAAVGKATAAYLAARSLSHPFGVGFMDHEGAYQTIQIVPGDDSGFDGNAYLPFDQLGEAP
ncbi:MAG: hypothetical protein AB1482_03170 [Pseudomonadota bacterium]